jgi:hypothetical protein
MAPSTARQAFRETLAGLAAKTKTRMPALNGRVEKAVRLALAGDVELHDNGTATVYSSSDPTRRYEIIEGTCTCQDWDRAPEHLCQHRLSAGLVRRVQALLPQEPEREPWPETDPEPDETPTPQEPGAGVGCPTPATQPCPEAAFSITLKGKLNGQEALLTARGQTAAEFKANLGAITGLLDPVQAPRAMAPTPGQGQEWCQQHQVALQRHENAKGVWFSHYVDGKHCKGRS